MWSYWLLWLKNVAANGFPSVVSAVTCGWDTHLRTAVLQSRWSESLEVKSWSFGWLSPYEAFYISQTALVQSLICLPRKPVKPKPDPGFVLLNIVQALRWAQPAAFACAVSQDVLELWLANPLQTSWPSWRLFIEHWKNVFWLSWSVFGNCFLLFRTQVESTENPDREEPRKGFSLLGSHNWVVWLWIAIGGIRGLCSWGSGMLRSLW